MTRHLRIANLVCNFYCKLQILFAVFEFSILSKSLFLPNCRECIYHLLSAIRDRVVLSLSNCYTPSILNGLIESHEKTPHWHFWFRENHYR
jgi:hypothetical protein